VETERPYPNEHLLEETTTAARWQFSETKSIARIAGRGVLSENALSVLVPILEETLGWNGAQIRDLFTSCGVVIHEWDKVRTDWVTFQRIPTPFVVNETEATDSASLG